MKNKVLSLLIVSLLLFTVSGCGSSIATKEMNIRAFKIQVPDGWTELVAEEKSGSSTTDYSLFAYSAPEAFENEAEGGVLIFVGREKFTTPYGGGGVDFRSFYTSLFNRNYNQREYGIKDEAKTTDISVSGMEEAKLKTDKAVRNNVLYDTYEYTISAPYENKYKEDLTAHDVYILGWVASNSKNASSYKSLFNKIAKNVKVDIDLYTKY